MMATMRTVCRFIGPRGSRSQLPQPLGNRQEPIDVVRGVEQRRRHANLRAVLADAHMGVRRSEMACDRVLRFADPERDNRRAVALRRRQLEAERAETAMQAARELHGMSLDAIDADALEICQP